MGPATKLIPTLEVETDPDTIIVVIDDDTVYPRHLLESIVDGFRIDPLYAQVGHCGDPLLSNSESDFERDYGYPFGRPSSVHPGE